MTVRPKPLTQPQPRRLGSAFWLVVLDILAIATWGVLLLKYWLTGKLNVLLHPDYMWLANTAGICLLALSLIKAVQLLRITTQRSARNYFRSLPTMQHFSLFPRGWSSAMLLAVAVFGLQFTPQPFASEVALERGVTDTLAMTRSQPQSFRSTTSPEERSLIDWIRTLDVYPEPDAYTGQQANVEGFVIHPPELPDNYLMISRFVITCCAADTYPVGLPVKLEGSRSTYPQDTWLRVKGSMITETLDGQRHLTIQASELEEIEEPENPYEY
jgi:uncharacterized repeat protein (TIGR03943 family)